jgi:hypothetical protein
MRQVENFTIGLFVVLAALREATWDLQKAVGDGIGIEVSSRDHSKEVDLRRKCAVEVPRSQVGTRSIELRERAIRAEQKTMPYTGGVEIRSRNCPEIIETRGLGAVESIRRIRTGSVEILDTAGAAVTDTATPYLFPPCHGWRGKHLGRRTLQISQDPEQPRKAEPARRFLRRHLGQ